MRLLAEECDRDADAFRMCVEASVNELNAYERIGDADSLRRVATEAMALLEQHAPDSKRADASDRRGFEGLCHNVAAALYRAREYDLAMPLFRRAIDGGILSAHARGWLAASPYATSGDRNQTLSLLRQAALHDYKGGRLWLR